MSKLANKPIKVSVRQGQPSQIRLNGKSYRVIAIADSWRETGYWWEGEEERDFYRVETSAGAYVIYQSRATSHWFLHKVLD